MPHFSYGTRQSNMRNVVGKQSIFRLKLLDSLLSDKPPSKFCSMD